MEISPEQFKTIFNESLDVVIIIDPLSGNILCVNNTVRYGLGYDPQTLIGRHFSTLFSSNSPLKPETLLEETRTYGPVFAEQGFRHADGSTCAMDLTTTLIPWDNKGNVILATLRDVTEQRRAEEALKRSEELIENTLDLIAILNARGVFRYVSPSHKRLLGYEPEELTGKLALDLIHPEDADGVCNRFIDVLQNVSIVQSGEFRFRRKDGSWRILESIVKALPNNSGDTVIVVNSRDITERKRAEALQKGQNQVLEMIAKGASLSDVLDTLIRFTEKQSDGMLCSILLLDPNENQLRYYSAPSLPEGYRSAMNGLSVGLCCGSCGTAAYRREAVIVSDITNDPLWADHKEIALRYGIKTCWSTPIFSTNGDVLGTYAMHYHSPRNPSTSDLQLIKIATHIAGISIEHKQTEETLWSNLAQLSKKSRYETIVSSVTQSVHKSINLQDVLENAVEAMSTNIDGVEHVAIHLVEGEEAVIKAYRGHPDWFVERVKRLPYPKGLTWTTIIEGKVRYCPDVDEDTVIGSAGREVGAKSYLSMPIFWEGKAIGCISVHSFKKNAFEQEELKLLEIVAHQIEVAINNAKQTEALQQSEERYRTLFDQSPVGVYIFNADCTITHCNERMVRILQSSYDKIIGVDLRKLQNNCISPLMDNVLAGRPSAYEGFYEATNSPARLWVSIRLSPLRDAHSNVIGGMAVVEDITERKKMEEELMKAQKLESLGILAGGIAHDFNNLLTAILGNISVTRMYVAPEEAAHKRLGEAEKACIRAKDLTQQLLTFSRGGAPIKKVLTSLGELIKDTASFAVSGSKVRCEFAVDKELWPVEIDEGQISQVMNNLVINADQAMPYGGVIKIKIENASARNGENISLTEERYLKISIEDNGVGIGKEYLPRVFDPYFTTKQKGSGLGLATVYSIIKNHDGHIEVESELGVGTKFTIYLPATKGEEAKNGEEREIVAKGAGRVLVMDDEESVREVAGEMLRHLGYEVDYAGNGIEAIQKYNILKENGQTFDVVIIDLTIPGGMGGKEAMERLLDIDPRVNAIVSSGYSNDPVMAEYDSYGFKGVVCKPYRIEELGKTVQQVMRNGK